LNGIGVLKFINQDMLETILVVLEQFGVVFQHLVAPEEQFREIHQVTLPANCFILAVYFGELVDFSELLLRCYEMLKNNSELLQHYQNRFQHILIDEFQDTNTIQYLWMKLLYKKGTSMMVVGDDDQSIYGWRGAKSENINRFTTDYTNTEIIRLEQNYRSTSVIFSAANAVIKNNQGRMGKELWTDQKEGEPISVYSAYNEDDEARYVVGSIQNWVNQGRNLNEIAIL
jgi:DNA helicase-2/ATP-dependent DNA helicase PcrA